MPDKLLKITFPPSPYIVCTPHTIINSPPRAGALDRVKRSQRWGPEQAGSLPAKNEQMNVDRTASYIITLQGLKIISNVQLHVTVT